MPGVGAAGWGQSRGGWGEPPASVPSFRLMVLGGALLTPAECGETEVPEVKWNRCAHSPSACGVPSSLFSWAFVGLHCPLTVCL